MGDGGWGVEVVVGAPVPLDNFDPTPRASRATLPTRGRIENEFVARATQLT